MQGRGGCSFKTVKIKEGLIDVVYVVNFSHKNHIILDNLKILWPKHGEKVKILGVWDKFFPVKP